MARCLPRTTLFITIAALCFAANVTAQQEPPSPLERGVITIPPGDNGAILREKQSSWGFPCVRW